GPHVRANGVHGMRRRTRLTASRVDVRARAVVIGAASCEGEAVRLVRTGSAIVLTATLASVPYLGTEFMPQLDEGSLLIETRRLPSTSLPQGMAIAKDIEKTLLQFPEVQSIVTTMGRPEMATEVMGLYAGDVYVNFKPGMHPKADVIDEFIDRMDDALKDIPGIDYNFSAPM